MNVGATIRYQHRQFGLILSIALGPAAVVGTGPTTRLACLPRLLPHPPA